VARAERKAMLEQLLRRAPIEIRYNDHATRPWNPREPGRLAAGAVSESKTVG
jgi:hypothetical protein